MESNQKDHKDQKKSSRAKKIALAIATWIFLSAVLYVSYTYGKIISETSLELSLWIESNFQGPKAFIVISLFCLLIVSITIFLFKATEKNVATKEAAQEEEDRLQEEKLAEIQKDEESLRGSGSEKIDLVRLWAVNNKRLDLYHDITTKQADKSFNSAQRTMTIGFILLLAAVLVAAFSQTNVVAISITSIGAVGGLLSSYISVTFMKSQAASAKQLRQFFHHPVEISRMLSAERLLDAVDPENRGGVAQLIIEATLNVQMDEAKKGKPID